MANHPSGLSEATRRLLAAFATDLLAHREFEAWRRVLDVTPKSLKSDTYRLILRMLLESYPGTVSDYVKEISEIRANISRATAYVQETFEAARSRA